VTWSLMTGVPLFGSDGSEQPPDWWGVLLLAVGLGGVAYILFS
jgi:hypothetical protein